MRRSQSPKEGGQSQGQSPENDQSYGQDNDTLSKNELGTEAKNLVADDQIDTADSISGIYHGDADDTGSTTDVPEPDADHADTSRSSESSQRE